MGRDRVWLAFLVCLAVGGCSVPTLTVIDASDSGRDGGSVDIDVHDANAMPSDAPDVVTDNGCPDSACGCVDLQHDVMHCGTCGTACPTPPNTTALCNNGVCDTRCATTFADCDRNVGNGCEVDLATSVTDCGTCGRVCGGTGPANTVPACMAGTCGFACAAGFGDCDATMSNGCETTLNTLTHCGACNVMCPAEANADPACGSMGCGIRCQFGFGDCDGDLTNGCETNLMTSNTSCGACHTGCLRSNFCCNGHCQSLIQACAPL